MKNTNTQIDMSKVRLAIARRSPDMSKVNDAVTRIETRAECLEILRELLHSCIGNTPHCKVTTPERVDLGGGSYRSRRVVAPIATSDY